MSEHRKEVVERLKALAHLNNGVLTPKAVVDDARDPKSPLHQHFEWNDKAAAEKYRLDQARTLIHSVKFEVVVENKPMIVPFYVEKPDKDHGEQGYVAATEIATDKDLARAALAKEVQRVLSALERAEAVAAALELQDDVKQLRNPVEKFMTKIENLAA